MSKAFSLAELLVTVAIIAVLMALLMPNLVVDKEAAKRTACRSNLRQLIVVLHVYGGDNRDRLPPGLCDFDLDYPPVVSTNTWKLFTQYSANPFIIGCPGLPKPFALGGFPMAPYGYVLGYNYLGGHAKLTVPVANPWISPWRLTAPGSIVLMTDLNVWSPGFQSVAPHGPNGPIVHDNDASNPDALGATPKALGGIGGNIGALDGSVAWKPINLMKDYQLSEDAEVFGNW